MNNNLKHKNNNKKRKVRSTDYNYNIPYNFIYPRNNPFGIVSLNYYANTGNTTPDNISSIISNIISPYHAYSELSWQEYEWDRISPFDLLSYEYIPPLEEDIPATPNNHRPPKQPENIASNIHPPPPPNNPPPPPPSYTEPPDFEEKEFALKQIEQQKDEEILSQLLYEGHGYQTNNEWMTFNKQSDALETARLIKNIYNKTVVLFAKEFSFNGQYGKRKFIVTSYEAFFNTYFSMKWQEKAYYEIIPENVHCKLYLDIEYDKEYNLNIDGNVSMNILKDYIIDYILQELNISITRKDIIDMCSSDAVKFSRHLIIIFPNTLFKNNKQCGIFVTKMCDKIRKESKNVTYQRLQSLFILDNKGKFKLLIDEGVYSKNRSFRIYQSAKLKSIHAKKPRILLYTQPQEREFKSMLDSSSFTEGFDDFMDTLICSSIVDVNTKFIDFPPQPFVQSVPQKTNTNKNVQHIRTVLKKSTYPWCDRYMDECVANWSRETAPWAPGMNKIPNDVTSSSPLYNSHQKRGKITGSKVFLDDNNEPRTITYAVEGNRFCMNISRCHRSNNIYFHVNLQSKYVTQKCHDPDCQRFASPPIEVPHHVFEMEEKHFINKMVASTIRSEQ